MHSRRHIAISLEQAAHTSPMLSSLVKQAQDAKARLKCIAPLLPPGLRPHVQPGPLEGDVWCLIVKNSAAASKLRHLLPGLEAHLRNKGWNVNRIQIKILNALPWQSPM